ncbi:membrane protein insertase YidC [Pediococcus pentosaceus]|uniref:membrane protein insertase YidC n=1 Tax=Pediococcus pentosaceus TaxID=1255 RepID=UPI0011090F87|nr:membrane protein insertase YidC [Pediococcus pentosaceus]KAF0422099.1 membrane protein insertase YidC [Pediococcus pentosaceus]MBF7131022.1 membrane protein insertase YidC [Pediococcus pentosaceus]MBF7135612.1 membrane protein insertase YidC [Pediococcus pentosaceus]MCL3857750.1 membrane protein insertase YidC [Pediococcus pentosaceus]TLQ01193.1 membrane protein insertase YidC [Pediococcus pentosaceus]
MKKLKSISTITLISGLALVLSGCVQRDKHGNPYGPIYDYLAIPTQHFMNYLSHLLGGSYGLAIILVTFVVRLILLPLMLNQSRKATIQQEKMAFIQPQLKVLQARNQAAKTPEERAAISQEMMALYKDNNVSMTGGIGCLPIIIQFPVFAALYAAIQYSPELHQGLFLGINLAKPSILLAAISFLVYLLQGWLGTLGVAPEQRKMMRSMMIVSPLMILFFTFSSPGGLGLYFAVGGVFACIQTLAINLYRPKIKARIQEEMKKNPPKIVEPNGPVDLKNITETATEVTGEPETKPVSKPQNNKPRRNAGKQNHHRD